MRSRSKKYIKQTNRHIRFSWIKCSLVLLTFGFLIYILTDNKPHEAQDVAFLHENSLLSWKVTITGQLNAEVAASQAAYEKIASSSISETKLQKMIQQLARQCYERRYLYPSYPEGLDLSKKYMLYHPYRELTSDIVERRMALTGMIMEAQSLGRVIVLPRMMIPPHRNGDKLEIKPLEFFFEMENASSLTEVMDEAEFYGRYKKTLLKDDPVVWGFARSLSFTSPSSLVGRSETILERCFLDEFTRTSSLYWQPEFVKRTWRLPIAPHLMEMGEIILSKLPKDFVGVHIERMEKFGDLRMYPNLNNDTSPNSLVEKLKPRIPPGKTIFIWSNEFQKDFFDPLESYYILKTITDFSDLWGPESKWSKSVQLLSKGDPSLFTADYFQLLLVGKFVFDKSSTKIETFNDLTSDPKEGCDVHMVPEIQITTDHGPFIFRH